MRLALSRRLKLLVATLAAMMLVVPLYQLATGQDKPAAVPEHQDDAVVPSEEKLCSSESAAPIDQRPHRFLLEPAAACAGKVFLQVFVHSAVGNAERRDLIRRTWASVANLKGDRISIIFVLGRPDSKAKMQQLQAEAQRCADLLLLDSHDSSSEHKDLHAVEWLALRCRRIRFAMKADDTIVLNVFRLHDYLRDDLKDESNFVLCELRNTRCAGSSYLLSAEVLAKLHLCLKRRRSTRVGDAVDMQLLVKALGVRQLQIETGWETNVTNRRFGAEKSVESVVIALSKSFVPQQQHEQLWRSMKRRMLSEAEL